MYKALDKMDPVRGKGKNEISSGKNTMRCFLIILVLKYKMQMYYMTWNSHELVKETFSIIIKYIKVFAK